ncbi:MAG: serine hydroxymethyltransferase [Candidatus Kerfeldbacteria bacterium]|nr:serine hydroxymethyltransferase [Candidatus Kerfeldbacteria bacterium]
MTPLHTTDPDIAEFLESELERERQVLEMIPSENIVSRAVLEALGSVLTNKYSEGYPTKRYYGGNQFIDEVETLARERAKALFSAEHANVQPYSGSPANLAVYFALVKPGDTVMGMSLAHGGHLTHGHKVSITGTYYNAVQYPVGDDGFIDYDVVRALALEHKPKLIFCGATAYPRIFDFEKFRAIADEVNAYLVADMAHVAGLIAGGVHPKPFPHADVMTTTTHKTLRGPRGAMILCKREDRLHDIHHAGSKHDLATLIDRAIFPGLQGGPHNHQTAAIATTLKEAAEPTFKTYAENIVKNAKALAESLLNEGMTLVSGGTDNHLILMNLRPQNVNGAVIETALDDAHITVNKNSIPNDPAPPMKPSGIRIGSPTLTTRGFTEDDMRVVGQLIAQIIKAPNDVSVRESVKAKVAELTSAHPIYPNLSYL